MSGSRSLPTENPRFNNARGHASTLQLAPPFKFKQVTMSVFPLRANLSRLRSFCDNFLNRTHNPRPNHELTRFEPFIPYVYLVILDYGQMAREAANMGWVSQREVAFGVPLKWLVPKKGLWDFHDWAFTSPFIFVDNELSMSTGREVYGWPKTLAHLDDETFGPIRSRSTVQKVFSVSTGVRDRVYEGRSEERRPFLTITHQGVPRLADLPTNLRQLMRPVAELPNVAAQVSRLGMDLFRTLSGIAMEGVTGSPHFPNLLDPNFYLEQMKPDAARRWVSPAAWRPGIEDLTRTMFPAGHANTVNFKQFRDVGTPWRACYQGITNARMGVDDVSAGGLLGQANLALGQLHGGYRINLFRFPSLPIVDALGLEVADTTESAGTPVACLRPTLPFWLELDMSYGRGQTLAWRSRRGDWTPGEGLTEIESFAPLEPPAHVRRTAGNTPAPPRDDLSGADADPAMTPMSHLYSTARGPAGTPAGPFVIPNATVRIMPLLADEAVLHRFVHDYLAVEGHARFEAWGDTVYLVAINYSDAVSEVENVGLLKSRELRFMVPVKWYAWHDPADYEGDLERRDREQLISVATVTAFSYSDEAIVAITRSEVDGVPTLRAQIDSPPDKWMNDEGPASGTDRSLLEANGIVIPALGVGAGGRNAAFLQVSESAGVARTDEAPWRDIAHSWGGAMVEALDRKHWERGHVVVPRHPPSKKDLDYRNREVGRLAGERQDRFHLARCGAMDLLSGQRKLQSLALKQFRDAWQTDEACYQGLVLERTRLDRVRSLEEVEHPVHVHLTRFPTQPVAQVLGLVPKHTQVGPDGIVDIFEAVRPCWLQTSLVQEPGVNVFERVGSSEWKVVDPDRLRELGLDAPRPPDESLRVLAPGFLAMIDEDPPSSVVAMVKTMQDKMHSSTTHGARAAMLGGVAPATVIDSLLSRQWFRPLDRRRPVPRADYALPVSFLGDGLRSKLFPEQESDHGYWPLSPEGYARHEQALLGLRAEVWSEIWEEIGSILHLVEDPSGIVPTSKALRSRFDRWQSLFAFEDDADVDDDAAPPDHETWLRHPREVSTRGKDLTEGEWEEVPAWLCSLYFTVAPEHEPRAEDVRRALWALAKSAGDLPSRMSAQPIYNDDVPSELHRRIVQLLRGGNT